MFGYIHQVYGFFFSDNRVSTTQIQFIENSFHASKNIKFKLVIPFYRAITKIQTKWCCEYTIGTQHISSFLSSWRKLICGVMRTHQHHVPAVCHCSIDTYDARAGRAEKICSTCICYMLYVYTSGILVLTLCVRITLSMLYNELNNDRIYYNGVMRMRRAIKHKIISTVILLKHKA